jgi:hypothetical protein
MGESLSRAFLYAEASSTSSRESCALPQMAFSMLLRAFEQSKLAATPAPVHKLINKITIRIMSRLNFQR